MAHLNSLALLFTKIEIINIWSLLLTLLGIISFNINELPKEMHIKKDYMEYFAGACIRDAISYALGFNYFIINCY